MSGRFSLAGRRALGTGARSGIASKPGIALIGLGKLLKFSIIFDWPSRSISNEAARKCGTTLCISVV